MSINPSLLQRLDPNERPMSTRKPRSPTTPVSYDSLKYIIQCLEANKRIQLIRRCPSLRIIEKTIPLQIDSMILSGSGVEINNIMYQISFYQDSYDRPSLTRMVECAAAGIDPYPPKLILFETSRLVRNHKLTTVEKYKRNMTHREAVVSLFNKIFSGRSGGIYVNNFISGIHWNNYDPSSFGASFKVSNLRIWQSQQLVLENLNALRRITHESSLPLKSLWCDPYKRNELPRLLEETVKDVEVLQIKTCLRDLLPVLTRMPHSVVHFETNVNDEMLKMLIEHWKATNRLIGNEYTFTTYTVSYGKAPELQNQMKEICEHFNGVTIDEETMILPMNEVAQIKVSYGKRPHFAPDKDWALRVLVEAVGTTHAPIKKQPFPIDRPLSYDSMKILLQHFEPNLRIQMAKCCPSIRAVEKKLPFKINELKLMKNGVKINGKSYEISTQTALRFPPNIDCYACAKNSAYPQKLILFKTIYYIESHKFEEMERYEENKTLEEAVTFLLNLIFGERTGPIYVKKFFNGFEWRDFGLLSFDVKFHIKNLKGYSGDGPFQTNFEALRQIIHDSSFPLKLVEFYPSILSDINHPIVNHAEVLRVRIHRNILSDFLTKLSNPLVHFESLLTDQELKMLIEHWTATNRPMGNEYLFTFDKMPELQGKMEEVREHFDGKTIDKETMIIPMNETAQIKICYGDYPEFAPDEIWALTILVEAVGKR